MKTINQWTSPHFGKYKFIHLPKIAKPYLLPEEHITRSQTWRHFEFGQSERLFLLKIPGSHHLLHQDIILKQTH